MAQQTTNLKLVKPELGDAIDPKVFSDNFDILDEAITKVDGKITSVDGKITFNWDGQTLNIITR